jgi:hypothetical protein
MKSFFMRQKLAERWMRMKKRLLVLGVLFSVLFFSAVLIGATGRILSEATLSPGKPWTEWKEFNASGVGSKVLWRFGFSDAVGEAFSVQLKNDTVATVSFLNFFVVGVGSGENRGWRGMLKPGQVFTLRGKSYPPGRPNPGEKVVIKAHLGSLSSGDAHLKQGLTEEENQRLNSPEVKDAKNYTQNLYQKYIQTVGAGNSPNVKKGVLGKYLDAKKAEEKAKSTAISASGSSGLEAAANPAPGSATSPASDPNF